MKVKTETQIRPHHKDQTATHFTHAEGVLFLPPSSILGTAGCLLQNVTRESTGSHNLEDHAEY
jgi:hypothetical protein